jgi:hypothetical protein
MAVRAGLKTGLDSCLAELVLYNLLTWNCQFSGLVTKSCVVNISSSPWCMACKAAAIIDREVDGCIQ